MMRLVVLDGRALNPGDVSWDPLARLGQLEVHEFTAVDQIVSRAQQADAIFTVRTPLNRETIRHLPRLRYIGVLGSDSSHVNVDIARKRGIDVADTAGADTEFVAQLTVALMLELACGVGRHAHEVRGGRWCRSPDGTFRLHPLTEVAGLSLGVAGLGRIGRAVARAGHGLGMRVLGCDPAGAPPDLPFVERRSFENLLAEVDVLSLHCPRLPATERMINAASLARMKPTAFLINTANGALIDEPALAEALRTRRLAGAALDVLSEEPPSPKNPLLRAPRCLITPHLGWGARAVRERIIRRAAEQFSRFLSQPPAAS